MFDAGQKLVCVDDQFPDGIRDIYNALPEKGKIYTFRDMVPGIHFSLKETVAIYVDELVNRPNQHGIEPGFKLERFRELEEDELTNEAVEEEELLIGN